MTVRQVRIVDPDGLVSVKNAVISVAEQLLEVHLSRAARVAARGIHVRLWCPPERPHHNECLQNVCCRLEALCRARFVRRMQSLHKLCAHVTLLHAIADGLAPLLMRVRGVDAAADPMECTK